MSIQDGTTNYTLQRSIEYGSKDGFLDAEFIELREPSMEHVTESVKLKQIVSRVQMDLLAKRDKFLEIADGVPEVGEIVKDFSENADSMEDEADDEAAFLEMTLLSSETVDASEFLAIFQKMACKTLQRSVCVIDGKEKMTPGLWAKLHPDDAFGMAIKWCAFFVTALDGAAKNTSKPQSESVQEVKAV